MSEQACQTPLIELLRSVPKEHRTEWEIQWGEDGRPTGHAMSPIGKLCHDAADRIAGLEAELKQGNLARDLTIHCELKDRIAGLEAHLDDRNTEVAWLKDSIAQKNVARLTKRNAELEALAKERTTALRLKRLQKMLDGAKERYVEDGERIAELEARLKQSQQWRDYYRDRWMGESMDGVTCPPTDAQLEAALQQGEE